MQYIIYGILLASIVLASLRSILGPDAPNRAVAIDVLTTAVSGTIVVFAVTRANSMYLDVTLIYALLSFLTVVAVARFMERGL
ncbi:MAG: monovalent cation/H+ antiporter complex subunit F [Myxococcota bacterium]